MDTFPPSFPANNGKRRIGFPGLKNFIGYIFNTDTEIRPVFANTTISNPLAMTEQTGHTLNERVLIMLPLTRNIPALFGLTVDQNKWIGGGSYTIANTAWHCPIILFFLRIIF